MKSVLVLASAVMLLAGCASSQRHVGDYRVIKGLSPHVERLLNDSSADGYSFVCASVSAPDPQIHVIVQRDHASHNMEYRVTWLKTDELEAGLNDYATQGFDLLFFTFAGERSPVIVRKRK